MAQEENKAPVRSSIINYVENFLDKRNLELRASTGDESDSSATQEINKDSIVIRAAGDDGYRRDLFDSQQSASTDIDADDLNLDSDPIVETHEGGEQVYKQQVFLRQYQPPTPEPIDIQVQEIAVKPQIQRAPIHVHVGPAANRETQRTPSPILIKSAPPPAPPATEETVFYNKYVPLETKPLPQQIIIHRYPELPPKPRPIVVEQWLPNKPAPKRITYHHINPEEYAQNETRRSRNRFIEYKKPHTTIEVEIIRLPIVKLKPEEYGNRSPQLTRLDQVRSMTQDPNTLNWRI